MSIAFRIIGWIVMVLAVMLEAANLILLLTGRNWGLIEFLINTLLWGALFLIGFALNKVGVNRKGKSTEPQ